jgi:sugar phosphate isomerase/epimerase
VIGPTHPASPSLGEDDLILASGSLPRIAFDQRVAAAAEAGFDAIGLSVGEYTRSLADGHDAAWMRAVLDSYGLRLAELEVLVGFAAPAEPADAIPRPGVLYPNRHLTPRFWDMAEAFGARHLQAVGTFGTEVLEDEAAASFADLCDQAAEHGLLVALEFVPVATNIPDVGVASRIVAAANRPNGGLCVDSWHHFRGAHDWNLLGDVQPDRVFVIQLDDGPTAPVDPDFLTDTKRHRKPPGQGEFDLVRFLRTLWDAGVRAPVSVEVLSEQLRQEPPGQAACTLADATRSVLAVAGQRRASEVQP